MLLKIAIHWPLITWINLKNRYSFNTDETTGYEFLLWKQMQKKSGFQYYKKYEFKLSNFNSNWMEFKEFKNSFKNKHTIKIEK